MKSIKPGRGPSMMGGISAIFTALFGVIWTIVAASNGGGFFALFGLIFIAQAIVTAVYNFKNAKNKYRFSTYDIVDSKEESDPFQQYYKLDDTLNNESSDGSNFCPYCGTKVEAEYEYCNNCGKKLP